MVFAGCINSFCGNTSAKQETGSMNAATVYTIIPVGSDDKTVFNYIDSLAIIEYGSFRIFHSFSIHTSNFFVGQNEDGSPKSQKTTVTTKNRYFITKPGQKYGYYIDSANLSMTGKNSVDSLYKANSFLFTFYKVYDSNKNHSVLYSSKKESEERTIDKFIPVKKINNSFADTLYYYFSAKKEFTDINFSLSPEQDKMGKGKMYKAVGKYIGDPKAEKPFEKLERDIIIEMKPKKITNPELIKKLCEKAAVFFTSSN